MTIAIRDIEKSDIEWIRMLLIDGTQSKHFGPTVGTQARPMLEETIANQRLEFLILRDGKKQQYFRKVKVFVADVDGMPASFLMCAEDHSAVELHLAATKKEYRKQGCFGTLIQYALNEYRAIDKKYARCYKKSTWALDGLKKCNFKITKGGNPVELVHSHN
jgi:hypothetical protein